MKTSSVLRIHSISAAASVPTSRRWRSTAAAARGAARSTSPGASAGSGPYGRSYALSLRELAMDSSPAARDHRDVVLVRSTDGGATWSDKVRVNDDPPRFDNSLPEVEVDGRGRVQVAWYDRRSATD